MYKAVLFLGRVTFPLPCLCQHSAYTAINIPGRTSTLERHGLWFMSHNLHYMGPYYMLTRTKLVHGVMHCIAS